MSISYFVVLAVAGVLIFVGANGIRAQLAARNWVEVSAAITSISEEYAERVIFYAKVKYYFPKIRYRYCIDGMEFTSDRVSLHLEDVWIPEVDYMGAKIGQEKRFWSGWQVGQSISVFVDPAKPRRSVIIRQMSRSRRSQSIALICGGFLCFLLFLALVFLT